MNMPKGSQPVSRAFAKAMAAEVRATLARQNMTVKQLAELCDLSPSYLGKRLRDESALTLNDLEAICSAVDKDILSFVTAALDAARQDGAGR